MKTMPQFAPSPIHTATIRYSLSASRFLLLILFAGIPLTVWGGEGDAARLQNHYQELRDLALVGLCSRILILLRCCKAPTPEDHAATRS